MSLGSNVYTATVLASVPEIGFAVVTRNKHNPQITDLIIAYLPYGDGPFGASPMPQISVGSSVLCASYDSRPVAYILGNINDTPGDNRSYGGELFYHVGKIAETLCSMDLDAEHKYLDTLLADLGDYIRSARGATDGDARPGDYNVTDSAGLVGFHVGRLLSMLRGSPLAYVDVSAITHKVRMVGKTLEFHTLAGETVISETLHAVNTALSPREAMGLLSENFTVATVDDLPDTLPFYRMQQLKGKSPAGSEDAVLTPPKVAEQHTQAAQPLLLRKHRVGFSGEEQLLNAHSVGTIKTPDIRGIMQSRYDTDAEDPATELRIPYKPDESENNEETPKPPDAETAVDDAALHQTERYDADYTEYMKLGLAADGLAVGEESLADEAGSDPPSRGAVQDSAYPLPPILKILDPSTRREHTYYLSTSFIRQLEDGSIVIGDGYGSEIRMSRGNIYIASALDTFIRPGRDAVQMVPRNLVLNTQGVGIFNTKGSLYLRASEAMNIGVTGKKGHLNIECRSADGLSIRSNSGLSITCISDMYIGRNAHSTNSDHAVTEPDVQGSIIIDAGRSGVVTQLGGECSLDANNVYLKAHDGSSGSMMLLTPSAGILGTQQFQITGTLMLQRFSGDLVMHCREGITSVDISIPQQDSCHLLVSGYGQFRSSILTDDSLIVVNQIQAASVVTVNGQLGSYAREQDRPKASFPSADKSPANLGLRTEELLTAAEDTVYRDAFIMDNAFSFPDSDAYGVPNDLRMPAMLWQINSDNSGNWQELPVEDEVNKGTTTYCYPGEVWETAAIGDADYGSVPLKDNYRINA